MQVAELVAPTAELEVPAGQGVALVLPVPVS
jgi:hypothetical protein